MTTPPDLTADSAAADKGATRAAWLPLIVIVLVQLQMSINISALPISLGPLAADLNAPGAAFAQCCGGRSVEHVCRFGLGTPQQMEAAVAINNDSGIHALRGSFLIVACISLLAIFPVAKIPKYTQRELSAEDIVNETGTVLPVETSPLPPDNQGTT